MSDWRYIYGEINEKIHANGIKAISGQLLNEVLTRMIEAVDGNLPEAGKGLNDIDGTFMRDLSIDGKYSSYYNANAGENDYTRVCLLRHNDFAKYNNIIIAVGFSRNVDRKSDLIFVNVGGATPTIKTLTTSNAFFLETTVDGNAYLCLRKETSINNQFNCAFSILMASTNTGEAMVSGYLNNFEFYTVEIPATGTIIAPVRISEPPLPATPENPETKFLNGNREWTEAGTEYTAGPNITITNGEIDTKRVLELTDITISGEVLAGKITANGVINGSLFFGLPITTTTLSGNATWNIDDLKNMMKVVLSSSTNSITLPNGGENPFRFQIIVAQDSTGSRALTISGVSGVNVYNPSEFDFSGGGANQLCVCTIIWDGTEYIYECTNYVGGE